MDAAFSRSLLVLRCVFDGSVGDAVGLAAGDAKDGVTDIPADSIWM